MRQDDPSSPSLSALRSAYRSQRYPGDLGRLATPRPARFWQMTGIAALLAMSSALGWMVAPTDDPPLARRDPLPPVIDEGGAMKTLELPLEVTAPPPAVARERRPVLPGLLSSRGDMPGVGSPARLRPPRLPPRPRGLPVLHYDNTHPTDPTQDPLP